MHKGKRNAAIIAGAVVLLALMAGGVWAMGNNNGTAAPVAQPAAQTAPQAAPSADRAVVAKGIVVPVEHATLSMTAGGIVARVLVSEGDPVTAGQVLVQLRNERQAAALAEAEAALAAATAQRDRLVAGARPEEIASVQAGLDAARARLAQLTEGARTNDIAAARTALSATQASLKRLYDGPTENMRIAAAAELANAEAALRNAQAAYDKVKDRNDVGMLPQSLQLEQATNAYNAAKASYDELFAKPDADRVAGAEAQVKQAQADLDRLLNPATAGQIAEAEAGVRQAEAQLALLTAGARAEDIAAAEAAVSQAEAARRQAAAALAETELVAPFAGTVATLDVRAGEQVVPGSPLAEMGSMGTWQVETDDLSELDVAHVQPGESVTLTFDALPDLTLTGVVERLQAKGEKKLGDMTYTAIIRINEADPRLMWNMTAVMTARNQ